MGNILTETGSQVFIRINKQVKIPDRYAIERCRKAPEAGPAILFFSGGSALKKLSQKIINYSHNTIHIITPFDSGGSSAYLRKAFYMLSVGDIRNRIMSLADHSIQGNPDIFELFSYRFDKNANIEDIKNDLSDMVKGRHKLISSIIDPMRKIIRIHLKVFYEKMPEDFDLRGASIGNLVLTGGYLNNDEHIDPVIFLFSKLVEARATVRPVTSKYLDLAAELENGEIIIGQHLITGKEKENIKSPISSICLSSSSKYLEPAQVKARKKIISLIRKADIICYPMGSFYSSVVANFLVYGIGQAISENPCLKVYIPNTGKDPEQIGMTANDCVSKILHYLEKGCEVKTPPEKLLNFILIDSKNGSYQEIESIKKTKGISIIDTELVTDKSSPNIDEEKLCEVLLSLA